MKKLYYLIVIVLISSLVLTGCFLSNIGQVPTSEQSGITYLTKGGPTENEADEYTLYAGQNIPVGTVNVWNDSEKLYVQYVVDDPWEMTGSHLYVGKTDPVDFPSTPGQFPYSPGMEKSPSPSALYDDVTMTYTIPLAEIYNYEFVVKGQGKGLNAMGTPGVEPCNEIYIAAQAEVFRSYELVNPGAEDGMNDWNIIGPVGAVTSSDESTGTVLPRSDMYFFDMTTPPAEYAKMFQGVNVAGFDGTSFNANCWIQTELYPDPENTNIIANDYGELVLTFEDEFNAVLESFTTGPIGHPVFGTGFDGYAQFSLTGNIPDGAVTAIYKLEGFLAQGIAINVFYDDLSFEYWQEETAWAEGDSQVFGKNWATYFTYHIAGEPLTISSEGLDDTYNINTDIEFTITTDNPLCGFAYSNVLFNYTIFDIDLSDIANFEYFDGTNWGNMPMVQSGSDVEGFFGPWPDGFPMSAPYDVTTTFRINIKTPGTYEVTMTLDNLNFPFEQLAILTQEVDLVEPSIDITKTVDPTVSKVGDVVVYTITIHNDGDIGLEGITVSDSILGDLSGSFAVTLAVGASEFHDFLYVIEPGDPDPLLNTVTVHANPLGMTNDITDEASAEVAVFPETLLVVGDSYGGGIVAYILQDGDPGYDLNVQHGLIAATEDQSTGIAWITGGSTQTTWVNGSGYGGTSTDYGTGQANTNAMMDQAGYTGGAAKVCDDYSVTVDSVTYNDWFLPSKDELNILWLNKVDIGGFADDGYWSSSEYVAFDAWDQYFNYGGQFYYYKNYGYRVRAVRAF